MYMTHIYIHTYTYTATILQGIEPTSYHLPTENILEQKYNKKKGQNESTSKTVTSTDVSLMQDNT